MGVMCEVILYLVNVGFSCILWAGGVILGIWRFLCSKACELVVHVKTIVIYVKTRIMGIMREVILCLVIPGRSGFLWVWGVISGFWIFGGLKACGLVINVITLLSGYLPGKKSVTCYVRKRPDTNLDGADMELWDKVRKEMSRKHNFGLKILEVDEMPRDQSVITFILCPVISRVASNVEHALKGIVSQKNIVLLLFHPVAPHVSFSGNTKWVLVEPKHQALGDIVDVVMWSTGAGGSLYQCPLNSDAVNQICNFIQWHSLTPK